MAIERMPGPGKLAAGGPWPPAAPLRAMITYRSGAEFQTRFGRLSSRSAGLFDVEHYLRRQGEKLVARFDAASYVALMRTMDLHDLGHLGDAARATSTRVGEVTGVGIDSDILYPATEVRDWVASYRAAGARAEYREIASVWHDDFLIEGDRESRFFEVSEKLSRARARLTAATSQGLSDLPHPLRVIPTVRLSSRIGSGPEAKVQAPDLAHALLEVNLTSSIDSVRASRSFDRGRVWDPAESRACCPRRGQWRATRGGLRDGERSWTLPCMPAVALRGRLPPSSCNSADDRCRFGVTAAV